MILSVISQNFAVSRQKSRDGHCKGTTAEHAETADAVSAAADGWQIEDAGARLAIAETECSNSAKIPRRFLLQTFVQSDSLYAIALID